MRYGIQSIKKAREMRLSGYSLSEINREMNIPKSTLSNWLRDITLTDIQINSLKERIQPRISRGRMNSSINIRSARIIREKRVYEAAEREFSILINDPFFVLGLSLYWSSGNKTGNTLQFSSMDSVAIKIMSKWIERCLNIDFSRIKLRNYDSYRRIEVSDINTLRKVIAWQKLLIKYYEGDPV